MKTGPDISTIYRIARYYYAEGLSQEEIAVKEGFSRSQISRLIEKAKSLGLVKITVVPPSSQQTETLSGALVETLGLRTAAVVPIEKSAGQEEITKAIATRAADILGALLPGFGVVGIGWGKTVYETAMLLPRQPARTRKPLFVPLIGLSGDTNPNLQINTIIDRFSASFQSKGLFINLSSVREKESVLSGIEEQRIRVLREYWNQVEAAVVGLGMPPSTSINIIDELPEQYKEELKRSASCGDILAQFFDQRGVIFHAEHEYELLAFDVQNLPKLQRSICLAGGAQKVRGIIAAVRARFISDLITDEQTAHAILTLLREHPTERASRNTGQGATRSGAEVRGESA
jgi:DNA-binding transcriptional regulator LsrR (DeoR family)